MPPLPPGTQMMMSPEGDGSGGGYDPATRVDGVVVNGQRRAPPPQRGPAPRNPWALNGLDRMKVGSFRRMVDKPTRDNIDQISASMFGREFSPQERQGIMDYMIAKTSPGDLLALRDVSGDARSVSMGFRQKQVIDKMISRLPADQLGARARGAYKRATEQGFLRINPGPPRR